MLRKCFIFKNGFTLIELLGVLIVLAVIAMITIPIVDNSIKNSREEAYERAVENIITAARNYSVSFDLGYDTTKKPLYISELEDEGFLVYGVKNPIDDTEMTGCVWYYWDLSHKQYMFEYDNECNSGSTETEPTISITYNQNLINSNGWAKENVAVALSGNGEIRYCISNKECEPNEIVEIGNNTKFITMEGINYLCALSSNTLGTTDKECISVKLDKTLPVIEGVADIKVDRNDSVDLASGISFSDALSGIDGALTIDPSVVDTSTSGTKQVIYRIKDMAGNIREVIRNIIVDTEAPTVVFSLVDSSAINSNGWAKNDFYIRATITDNSGTGIQSGKSCTTNSSSECSPTASFTGTTKDFLVSVEGSNRACIEVTDNNNKTTKVCSSTYNLDKTAPTITGLTPISVKPGQSVNLSSGVSIIDSLSGAGDLIINPSSVSTSNPGTTQVTYKATDKAGNETTLTRTVTVTEIDPPNLTFSPTNSSSWTKAQNITLTASDNSNLKSFTYEIFKNGVSQGVNSVSVNGTTTSTVVSLSSDGNYTIKLVATDQYDNSNNVTSGTYKIDATAPNTFTISASSVTVSGFTVKGTTTDGSSGVANYKLYLNGSYHSTNTTGTFTLTGLSSGTTYTAYVIATDNAGNTRTSNTISQQTTVQYVWNKYTISENVSQQYSYGNKTAWGVSMTIGTSYTYNSSTKSYEVAGNTMYVSKYTSTYFYQGYRYFKEPIFGDATAVIEVTEYQGVSSASGSDIFGYREIKPVVTQGIGTYLGTVTSTSSSAYPTNGISGSYWYVRQ